MGRRYIEHTGSIRPGGAGVAAGRQTGRPISRSADESHAARGESLVPFTCDARDDTGSTAAGERADGGTPWRDAPSCARDFLVCGIVSSGLVGQALQVRTLKRLFDNNRRWAAARLAETPDFFARLLSQQTPKFLWIGCSDSRVPANEIVGLLPGELFVHRNVANVVVHSDLNCLAVLQYAVDALKVQHVIVCGHYGCGGVRAALEGAKLGLIDNWLRHVQDVQARHQALVARGSNVEARVNRLCELNVLEQAIHVCQTTIVQDAWARGQAVAVHAWIYRLEDGLLRDLDFCVSKPEALPAVSARAVELVANADRMAPFTGSTEAPDEA